MDGSWPRSDSKKIKCISVYNSFNMTVLLSECLSDREPSLYFVQNMLSKIMKTGNHKKMIVKQAMKMVIVIVKNTRYITKS